MTLNWYFVCDVERAGDQPVLYYLKYRALWICVVYTQYTLYLLLSDNLQIKDGRVKGNDWYRTGRCLTCDKAVLNSNLIIILFMNIIFNICCTYSRAFVYAVILPQRVRVGLGVHIKAWKKQCSTRYARQDWEGRKHTLLCRVGGGRFLNLSVSQICLGCPEVSCFESLRIIGK